MTRVKDRYTHDRTASIADKSKKNRQKKGQNRGQKNRSQDKSAPLPVKATVSVNKGSDLLLFASNKSADAAARPQRLHDGQTVYLRERRRPA